MERFSIRQCSLLFFPHTHSCELSFFARIVRLCGVFIPIKWVMEIYEIHFLFTTGLPFHQPWLLQHLWLDIVSMPGTCTCFFFWQPKCVIWINSFEREIKLKYGWTQLEEINENLPEIISPNTIFQPCYNQCEHSSWFTNRIVLMEIIYLKSLKSEFGSRVSVRYFWTVLFYFLSQCINLN